VKVPIPDLGPRHGALRCDALSALAANRDAMRLRPGKGVDDLPRRHAAPGCGKGPSPVAEAVNALRQNPLGP